ncbi:MAG: HAD-IA family hydrolase [Hyphomicrobiaceae bacterium]|nr:HAD-IA family hydrolase [Hyphomicrobiaceae bacterium]
MKKLVIFDCDGTLIDSQNAIVSAMTHAFASQNLPAPPRRRTLSVVGLSLPEAIAILTPQHSLETQAALIDGFRAGSKLIRGRGESEVLYPGISALVSMLASHDDVHLGIATGKSHRGVLRLFEQQNWHELFATIQTADNNPSKPHPQMIMSAMQETGVDPAQTVMIGDSSFDMAMARAARVKAIGVTWGYHTTDALNSAGAHAIAETSADLLTLLDNIENLGRA